MKKILTLILALAIAFSFAACGKKNTEETLNTDTQTEEITQNEDKTSEEVLSEDETEEEKEENISEEKEPENKPQEKPQEKPQTNPQEKPQEKPQTKPEQEESPSSKPETSQTVGNALLADFKAKAGSYSSSVSLAEALLKNPVIQFSGGAMPVEPGFLTGFDNTEIKGFKEGAMFAPMIGTIPFVGYVFTLEDSSNASDFISTLKSAANLRWNICTSADEMISGSSGNKVFFVMSPKSFDQE